jgi:heme exporter protein A
MDTAEGLQVEAVHVWRGERHVLKGVSCTVRPTQLVHVLGPNGTGKTTLLRVICGLLRPEQGEVRWNGAPVRHDPSAYHRALAYASHEPALKGDLTPLENLTFMVGLKRRITAAELSRYLDRTGVAHCADLPVRVLSAGQRRRVALARVLALEAPLWLLDEPYTHLDTAGSALLSQLLEEHVHGGGMALVVAHHEIGASVPQSRLELAA